MSEGGLANAVESLARAMDKVPGPISYVAAGVAMLFSAGKPLGVIAERLLRSSEATGPLPRHRGPGWLSLLIDDLTVERPIALYCRKPEHLHVSLRRTLMQALDGTPRLALGLPALERDSSESLWPSSTVVPMRVEILTHELDEMRSVLTRRFDPHRFPEELIAALWNATGGRPQGIAARLGDLVRRNVLQQDSNGLWSLSPEGLQDSGIVGHFKGDFLQPLYVLLEGLEAQQRRDLHRFLATAAVCGDFVPATSVLRFLGLPPERAEAMMDLVDATLVCPAGRRRESFADLVSANLVPNLRRS